MNLRELMKDTGAGGEGRCLKPETTFGLLHPL
jgi:hypothetical protein